MAVDARGERRTARTRANLASCCRRGLVHRTWIGPVTVQMVGERRTGRHIQANLTSPGRRILVHCTWAGLAPDASVTVNTPGERGTSDDCRISLILADERFLASRARVSLVAGEAGVDRGTWISVVSVPFAAPARAG